VKYRLGLDLGTNSLGWAAVSLDEENNPFKVLDMGVRIYPDGRNPKDKSSLATQRRIPRGMRRRRDRYLERRDDLMGALIAYGLMPVDKEERKQIEGLDPYRLRARALEHVNTPYELGRALFHLNQRRGFKSNRKTPGADESEQKKTKAEMAELRRRIEESGSRTLGEYLNRRHQQGRSVRARTGVGLYPDRALYEAEFEAIRAVQQPHHLLSDGRWERLREIIFHQRPLRPVKPGLCLFEEGEPRAHRALPESQEFRMVQEVNNLRVYAGSSQSQRPLTSDENKMVLDHLRSRKDLSFDRMITLLNLPKESKFNMATWGRKGLKGDETAARLSNKNIFGSRWRSLPLDERTKIVRFLLDSENPEEVSGAAANDWGLNKTAAERISDLTLPAGHVHLSEKAISKLLPLMRDRGILYWEAVKKHPDYAHHSDFRPDSALDHLSYYGALLRQEVSGAVENPAEGDDPGRYGRIANPTVHIGLNQLRRVVNSLIDRYGKPEHIVVELARELKLSRDQLRRREKQNKEGAERNTRFREQIEAAELKPTAPTLRKLRLWEEQEHVCPYTGTLLTFEMVTSAQTEIDHVLPVSQTLDDSPANMVVCTVKANRDKGNRSPYDAFGHDPAGYNFYDILERASTLPPNKHWRFHADAMERFEQDRDFLDRQLNETMYLSRTARTYLAHLFDEKSEKRNRVDVTPGRLTAALRRGWGLNNMLREGQKSEEGPPLPKQRDDHRHHAIDALVIACTSRNVLQSISRAASVKADDQIADIAKNAPPWPGFDREQVRPFLDRLVVSHKPDHGTPGTKGTTTGQLHDATAFGLVSDWPVQDTDVTTPAIGPATLVVRKKLDTFSRRSNLQDIRDQKMQSTLLELWDRVADRTGKPNGSPAEFAKEAWDPGVKLGNRLFKVRSVRVTEESARVVVVTDRKGIPYKAYKPNSNEYADLWEMPPWPYKLASGTSKPPGVKDGERRWILSVVSTFEANQPGNDMNSVRPHPAARRIARLHINDMCALGSGDHRKTFRIRKIDSVGLVHIDLHNEANVPERIRKNEIKDITRSANQLRKEGFRKIGVTEIGQVLDRGPRT
jgi:CRISPR-associated endonuclease Csn1